MRSTQGCFIVQLLTGILAGFWLCCCHLSRLQLTSELEAQLSSDTLAALYGSKALQITVKGFNGLAASGLFGSGGGQAEQLSLYIKFGRVLLEKPLTPLINPGTLTE
jgi:hypothetical protein